ncbi:hypothetical protein LEP1GSC043_2835 [Leptospira weilii str. Ecochallenge]|uniref:Uncharacterized protein n=1 Tax=Leptospira weilii str. Ecochallenge TaxID=1049986 RepID=N1TX48_9LEPT|nr:hypothetical protein LEP1GSC043_2835 [Leptospira weilii str. Ecochallenge]
MVMDETPGANGSGMGKLISASKRFHECLGYELSHCAFDPILIL